MNALPATQLVRHGTMDGNVRLYAEFRNISHNPSVAPIQAYVTTTQWCKGAQTSTILEAEMNLKFGYVAANLKK